MLKNLLSIFIAVLFLTACSEATNQPQGAGKYGMMDNSTPEGAALLFFDAIYDKNSTLDQVLKYSTPKMARLLKSYHTNRAVQRHVLNLTYDDVPEMQVDSGDDVGRTEFAVKSDVSIFFSGFSNGDKIDDLRTVKMLKIQNKWLVDSIKADKYM